MGQQVRERAHDLGALHDVDDRLGLDGMQGEDASSQERSVHPPSLRESLSGRQTAHQLPAEGVDQHTVQRVQPDVGTAKARRIEPRPPMAQSETPVGERARRRTGVESEAQLLPTQRAPVDGRVRDDVAEIVVGEGGLQRAGIGHPYERDQGRTGAKVPGQLRLFARRAHTQSSSARSRSLRRNVDRSMPSTRAA